MDLQKEDLTNNAFGPNCNAGIHPSALNCHSAPHIPAELFPTNEENNLTRTTPRHKTFQNMDQLNPGVDLSYGTSTKTKNTRPEYYQSSPLYNQPFCDFKPRTPIFDGKVDTWEPFIMQLSLMNKTYNWPEWKFHEQLLFSLRGDALLFASNLNAAVREDSTLLLGALAQRFGQSLLAETYRANLYNVRKSSKETLQEYSGRVNHLMSRAYPGMEGTPIYNNLLIEHLLKGLPDQRLAYEVLTRKPRDINEAINMIAWHEVCRQNTLKASDVRNIQKLHYVDTYDHHSGTTYEPKQIRNKGTPNHLLLELQRDLENLSKRFDNIFCDISTQEPENNHNKLQQSFRCYRCDQPGHISSNCPNRRRYQQPRLDKSGNSCDNVV